MEMYLNNQYVAVINVDYTELENQAVFDVTAGVERKVCLCAG